MILLREVQERDVEGLMELANVPGMYNLAGDRDVLKEKIRRSKKAFSRQLKKKLSGKFMFVAEDLETGKILGTSMIGSQHGTEEVPHYYFEVSSERKFAQTINTGFIHGTLELKMDKNGPSEIGGLVMLPDARNRPDHVGRQISFVRFLFLYLNPDLFKDELLAELLPPLNKRGHSPLWEAIGRRFTNMDYWEADELSQKDNDFISRLFPEGKIYATFFPAEARNAIGKVGKETQPAYHMLTKIGFKYSNHVDPFDGGPHLRAKVSDLVPLKHVQVLKYRPQNKDGAALEGLLCKKKQAPGEMRVMHVKILLKDDGFSFEAPTDQKTVEDELNIEPESECVFMDYYGESEE